MYQVGGGYICAGWRVLVDKWHIYDFDRELLSHINTENDWRTCKEQGRLSPEFTHSLHSMKGSTAFSHQQQKRIKTPE